jgi:hypothetical protein
MRTAKTLLCGAVGVESDKEAAAIAFADFPLAYKVRPTGHCGAELRAAEFDASNVCDRYFFLVAILVNHLRGSFKLDAGYLANGEALAMTIFKDDDDGAMVISGQGSGRCSDASHTQSYGS